MDHGRTGRGWAGRWALACICAFGAPGRRTVRRNCASRSFPPTTWWWIPTGVALELRLAVGVSRRDLPNDGTNPLTDVWAYIGDNAAGTPGTSILTEGIWYDPGNVGAGVDNDVDLIPDRNAWLQPVGAADLFDPSCFRLVHTCAPGVGEFAEAELPEFGYAPPDAGAEDGFVLRWKRRVHRDDVEHRLSLPHDLAAWPEEATQLEELGAEPDSGGVMETVHTRVKPGAAERTFYAKQS